MPYHKKKSQKSDIRGYSEPSEKHVQKKIEHIIYIFHFPRRSVCGGGGLTVADISDKIFNFMPSLKNYASYM